VFGVREKQKGYKIILTPKQAILVSAAVGDGEIYKQELPKWDALDPIEYVCYYLFQNHNAIS
jgi:hypothetical protein